MVEQAMNSGVTAYIAGRLGLGNRVITNSSACATGTQAILMGYEYIKARFCKTHGGWQHRTCRPLCFWYRLTRCGYYRVSLMTAPEKASRPMSMTAGGFRSRLWRAGALILEDLDFALARGAKIYAEVLGGSSQFRRAALRRHYDGG